MGDKRQRKALSQDNSCFEEFQNFLIAKAASMRWLFYCAQDKQTFVLSHNHRAWPSELTLEEKINMKPHSVVNIVEQGNDYICSLVSSGPYTNIKDDQRLCYERLSQTDETLQDIFLDSSSTTQQVALEPERPSTQVELPAVTLGISPHHMLQSQSPRAVSCSPQLQSTPILNADASLMIQQQQAFMEKFLHQQNSLTADLLKQNKTLCRSVNRLIAIIETNNLNQDSQSTEQPSEPLDEAFSHEGQNLLDIPKEKVASLFGHNLARVLFGNEENCELINAMISPGKGQKNVRTKCCDSKKEKFAKVVKKKYAKNPDAAYVAAREGANQMGRELRVKYPNRVESSSSTLV